MDVKARRKLRNYLNLRLKGREMKGAYTRISFSYRKTRLKSPECDSKQLSYQTFSYQLIKLIIITYIIPNSHKNNTKKSGLKRTLLEWGGIAAVIAILYVTGLHTVVLGTMQRALMWTGLFDAEGPEVTSTDGPMLSNA